MQDNQPHEALVEPIKQKVGPHLELCNPDIIFTREERLELERDLQVIVDKRRHAAERVAHIFLD